MCAYFSRRHHLAGRGNASQDAAAATVLLGDYHAHVTGSTLDKAVIDLRPKEACTGLTFVCLGRAKRLVDLMVEPMSFDSIGNLGNSLTTKARLQEEVRLVELAQSTRVRYTDMGVTNEVPFSSCLLYTSPSPRDLSTSRMPSSA